MIASGSKDQTVRIWYLTAKDKEGGGTLMESKQVAAFDSHKSSVSFNTPCTADKSRSGQWSGI